MRTREEEYVKMLRALGYEPNLAGMDEEDFDYVPSWSSRSPGNEPPPELNRPFRPEDRDFAERIFKMFARPFDPNWQMPNLDGPEYSQLPKLVHVDPQVTRQRPGGPVQNGGGFFGREEYDPDNESMARASGYAQGDNATGAEVRLMSGKGGNSETDGNYIGEQKLQSIFQGPNPTNIELEDTFPPELKPSQGMGGINAQGQVAANKNLPQAGLAEYLRRLGDAESSGNYGVRNERGYLGKYQLGDMALADAGMYHDYLEDGALRVRGDNSFKGTWTDKAKKYGVTSMEDFLNSPEAQEAAIRDFSKKNWDYIRDRGLEKHIGKEINGIKVTASGLLAAAHLGGIGALRQLFGESLGLETDENGIPIDGNKKPVTDYLRDMGGLDLTELLGYNPDKNLQ